MRRERDRQTDRDRETERDRQAQREHRQTDRDGDSTENTHS